MGKLVVLEVGKGTFDQEFEVILEIGEESDRHSIRFKGTLPPAPDIPTHYQRWQSAYLRLDVCRRIEIKAAQTTNISIRDTINNCGNWAVTFKDSLTDWYNSENFSQFGRNYVKKSINPQKFG